MCGIAGGVPPEVVEYDRLAICQWAARGAFLDLAPLIEQDRKQLQAERQKLEQMEREHAPPHAVKEQQRLIAWLESFAVVPDDYYQAPWDECTYQERLYGIPHTMDDRVLYYNDDLLVRAHLVHDEMGRGELSRHKGLEDLGVKKGPFYVLYMASMPSILIETGFLTNKEDAKLLRSKKYLRALADQIAAGLVRYRDRSEKLVSYRTRGTP